MAVYDQTIRIGADTSPAERAVNQLAQKLNRIEKQARNLLKPVSLQLSTDRAQRQINQLERSLDRLSAVRVVRVRVVQEVETRALGGSRSGGGGGGNGVGMALLGAAAGSGMASRMARRALPPAGGTGGMQLSAAAAPAIVAAVTRAEAEIKQLSKASVLTREQVQQVEQLQRDRATLLRKLGQDSDAVSTRLPFRYSPGDSITGYQRNAFRFPNLGADPRMSARGMAGAPQGATGLQFWATPLRNTRLGEKQFDLSAGRFSGSGGPAQFQKAFQEFFKTAEAGTYKFTGLTDRLNRVYQRMLESNRIPYKVDPVSRSMSLQAPLRSAIRTASSDAGFFQMNGPLQPRTLADRYRAGSIGFFGPRGPGGGGGGPTPPGGGAGGAGDSRARGLRDAKGDADGLAASLGRVAAAYLSIDTAIRAATATWQAGLGNAQALSRLQLLSSGLDDYSQVLRVVNTTAEKFNLTQEDAATQVAQLYGRLRPMGFELDEITTVMEGFSIAAKLSGTSTAETAGALLQLSQALGANALRGQELNSVLEQAPLVAQAIAKELNTTVGQLKKLAEDGKITSDVVVRALERIRTEGADKLAASLNTPAARLQTLAKRVNELQVAISKLALPALLDLTDKISKRLEGATTFVTNFGAAWAYVANELEPVLERMGALAWYFKNLTPPGWAMQVIEGAAERGRSTVSNLADRNRRRTQGSSYPLLSGGRYAPGDQQTPFTTPNRPSLEQRLGTTPSADTKNGKTIEEAVRRGVIGGLTGGGQRDASRGHSSGPHLHAQLVRGGNLERLVDQALDFGGGRTASSFGLGRGAGPRGPNGHGYPARDYYTPQGTPFTLRPGYTAKDLGIRGELGRGLQISGPGGSFQLGHLSGVRMGDLNGKGAAGDLLDAQQDALNAAVEAEAELAQKRAESLKAGQALTTELQRQLDGLNAVDDAAREQLRIQFEWQDRQEKINELLDEKQKKDLTALNSKIKEIELLKEQQKILDEMQGGGYKNFSGGNIDTYTDAGQAIAESKKQLEDLTNPINQVVAGATAIGAAFGESFKGLVSGAMTAQEALRNFFQKTADHFLDMAAKIAAAAIQHAIISTIFRGATGAITGGAFGGGGIDWGQTPSVGGVPNLPGLTPFATGGIVTGPTPALIGEREPEAVIPLSRMGEAMQRFNPGKAEASRANGTGGSSDGSGGGASPITMNVVATRFGDTDFVKVADMQAALAQTRVEAAKQGAAMGESRTLRRLQNSPGSRRKLGLA